MGLSEEVALAMEGLEGGQRVHHIASFPVRECSARDDVQAVLNDPQLKDFDYIPVREGSIIGVLERPLRADETGLVIDSYTRLNDSLIAAAETPLGRFLPMLETQPYRLVVREGKVDGIVTRSDLNKLPVRVHIFARIAHFEMLLGALIIRCCPDDESVLRLVEERTRKDLRETLARQRRQGLNPPVIVLMHLTQKWKAAAVAYSNEVGPDFTAEMKEIAHLRNAVAHVAPLVPNRRSFGTFYRRLHLLERWTERLDDLGAQERAAGAAQ